MKRETLNIIANAISDVGYWRWWITKNDTCQIEFGGVRLLNNDTINRESKSAVIALQYSKNSFLIFFDKFEEIEWHKKLQNDEIEPFTVDDDSFIFNDYNSINEIEKEYQKKIIIKADKMGHIKNSLLFKAGNVAVAIGGDDFKMVDGNGIITEEKIIERNKLWWLFWKDYWKKRETKKAYSKDYVCEVTIPIRAK
jgi:hypothetical protein